MTAIWDDEHRTSIDDCSVDRCPINKFEGQCHLRRGHVGKCDPHGESHWESDMEAAPGVDGVELTGRDTVIVDVSSMTLKELDSSLEDLAVLRSIQNIVDNVEHAPESIANWSSYLD